MLLAERSLSSLVGFKTKMSVTNSSPFQDYPHPEDHTVQTNATPGFQPFTVLVKYNVCASKKVVSGRGSTRT